MWIEDRIHHDTSLLLEGSLRCGLFSKQDVTLELVREKNLLKTLLMPQYRLGGNVKAEGSLSDFVWNVTHAIADS